MSIRERDVRTGISSQNDLIKIVPVVALHSEMRLGPLVAYWPRHFPIAGDYPLPGPIKANLIAQRFNQSSQRIAAKVGQHVKSS